MATTNPVEDLITKIWSVLENSDGLSAETPAESVISVIDLETGTHIFLRVV